MSEQIDLHVFKAITAASCVDISVNKHLNNYNYISTLQKLAPVQLLVPVTQCSTCCNLA